MFTKALSLLLLLALTSIAGAAQQQTQAQTQPPAPPRTHLKVGQPAPDFTLTDTSGNKIKLSDFRGKKNVVLAFYVLAFTGG
jgi:peroxiredoxin Q/BCP